MHEFYSDLICFYLDFLLNFRICYKYFRALGLDIGSGTIESNPV